MSAVPKLRFPEFDGEWSLQSLGAVSEKPFYGMNSEATSYDGYNKYIRITDIDDTTRKFGASAITSPAGGPDKRYKLGEGDIVFARTGASVGKSYLYNKDDGDLFFAGFLIKFHIQKAYPKFVFFYTLTSQYGRWVIVNSARSGQPGINAEEYKSLEIPSPSPPEQQKIASFLSSVDKKIDLMRQKKDALELYKKGLMQKIFSQEIRFKQDDGSDFPDWEEMALSEIAKRSTEKNKDLELTLVLTNSAVQGVVVQTEYFDKSIANEASISGYYKVRKSDFVYNPRISSAAPVGPISQNMKDDGVMSPLYTVFRAGEPYQRFLNVYFKSSVWFDYMRSIANQGARHDRMNITTSDFMALPIDLPCAREREKIASFLSSIDVKIQHTSSQIQQMETVKKGLLQQMFV